MAGIEWRAVSPEEMIQEIEQSVHRHREDKYAFQNGLRDLDFDINQAQIVTLGLSIPLRSIDEAEQALKVKAISPARFFEFDGTEHSVLFFDPRPVGYSGFMDCVIHSLAMTDKGLFEVGRYPAVNLSSQSRFWQWFLHRRLATSEEVTSWQQELELTGDQLIGRVYEALTGLRNG